jgi:hypothetical protein
LPGEGAGLGLAADAALACARPAQLKPDTLGGQTMLQSTATVQENHERFVRRVIASEVVWGVRNESGFQSCESNEDDSRRVLLFWSDAAYARRAISRDYPECQAAGIELFNFLYRWLPGMAGDEILVGPNYTADPCGLELDPLELQDELLETMPVEMLERYRERLERELQQQRERDNE